jgi:hypothetical protein
VYKCIYMNMTCASMFSDLLFDCQFRINEVQVCMNADDIDAEMGRLEEDVSPPIPTCRAWTLSPPNTNL